MKNFKKKIFFNFTSSSKKLDQNNKSLYWKKSIKNKKDLFVLRNIDNFRNNNLSKNIDDDYLSNNQFKKLLEKIFRKEEKLYLRYMDSKNIGSANQTINYKKKIITPTDIYLTYYYLILKKKINMNKINIVCEIGQGYGLFASKLLKDTKLKIILIDLPESNLITAYYLKKKFPQKIIFMDTDLKNGKLDYNTIKLADIFILSPNINISQIKIDLFVNMRSMMEMNKDIIKKYLQFINRNISNTGYFFCVNRYYKDLVGYPIELHNYPFGYKWKSIYSKQSKHQREMHILLLKKISSENSNFKNVLLIIKKKYI